MLAADAQKSSIKRWHARIDRRVNPAIDARGCSRRRRAAPVEKTAPMREGRARAKRRWRFLRYGENRPSCAQGIAIAAEAILRIRAQRERQDRSAARSGGGAGGDDLPTGPREYTGRQGSARPGRGPAASSSVRAGAVDPRCESDIQPVISGPTPAVWGRCSRGGQGCGAVARKARAKRVTTERTTTQGCDSGRKRPRPS